MKKTKHCVQCGQEMKSSYGNEAWCSPFCENHKCPNYFLLQVGIEIFKTDKNKREKL